PRRCLPLVLFPAAATPATTAATVATVPAVAPAALPAAPPPAPEDAPPACAIALPASMAKKITATSFSTSSLPLGNHEEPSNGASTLAYRSKTAQHKLKSNATLANR